MYGPSLNDRSVVRTLLLPKSAGQVVGRAFIVGNLMEGEVLPHTWRTKGLCMRRNRVAAVIGQMA